MQREFEAEICGKMIVVDCPNDIRFPLTTSIAKKPYYRVSRRRSTISLHGHSNTANDEEIIELWLKNREYDTVPLTIWKWYSGVQVVTYFRRMRSYVLKQLSRLAATLVNLGEKRKPVKRGKKKTSKGTMTGLAQTGVPGHGALRQYRNFKNGETKRS